MLVRLLACSLSIAVLGCLMLGCSDDTQRITSPGTVLLSDPLSTGVDETDVQSNDTDDGFYFYPYDTTGLYDTDWPDYDDPMDRFDNDDNGSHKPIDNELDRE